MGDLSVPDVEVSSLYKAVDSWDIKWSRCLEPPLHDEELYLISYDSIALQQPLQESQTLTYPMARNSFSDTAVLGHGSCLHRSVRLSAGGTAPQVMCQARFASEITTIKPVLSPLH